MAADESNSGRDSEPGEDEGDEAEISKLPKPRRTTRSLAVVVMAVTSVLAALLAWQLVGEARYAIGSDEALDVGPLASAELGPQHEERYVRARVSLEEAKAVSFRRPFERNGYRVALAQDDGGGAGRWVVYPVARALQGPRQVTPTLVAGRLARVADLGPRYRGLSSSLGDVLGADPSRAWVLIDGNNPQGTSWVLGLEALLLAFVAFTLLSILRVMRRVG